MRVVIESRRTIDAGGAYGRLAIIGAPFYLPVGTLQKSRQHAVAQCECGMVAVVECNNVMAGRTTSCGCAAREIHAAACVKRFQTHGASYTHLYAIWGSMRGRCGNAKHKFFYRYGGRGITVCDEWGSFEAFRDWSAANGYMDGLTIDRKKNNEGYSPDNCEWITRAENTAKMHRDRACA